MSNDNKPKKKVAISFPNLAPELQAELKKKYPHGFGDVMMRIDTAPGTFFYAVPFETEDTSYLVKIDVKVDGNIDDDDDKEFFEDDDISGADELTDTADDDHSDEE